MNSANAVLITLASAFVILSVTMVFMHPDYDYGEPDKVVTLLTPAPPTYLKIFSEAIRRFEAQHAEKGWRVRYISVPYEHYYRKVQFMEVMDDQADVIYMDQAKFPEYMAKGMLEDLNPWIDADPDFRREDYFDMAFKHVAFDEQQLGMPFLFSPTLIFYNKTAFRAVGAKLPEPGWTYDEFLTAAKKLTRDTDGDGKIDFYGVVALTVANTWPQWIWREGGRAFSEDMSRCTLDSPEAIRALQFIQDMIHTHKVSPTPTASKALSDRERFKVGRAGMVFGSRFQRDTYLQLRDFEWDVAPIPKHPQTGLATTNIIVDSISLARHGKNKKLGWELMKFLVSEEMARVYIEVGTGLPGFKKVAREGLDPNMPGDRFFLDVPPDTRYPFQPYRAPKEIAYGVQRLGAIWSGREPAETIAREVAARINEGIRRDVEREQKLYGTTLQRDR